MTRRTTKKLSAVLVSLLFTSTAFAGLGGIQVRSSLGEALQANIALSGMDADEADKLRVSLASPGAFRDLNVDYAPVLGSLRFAVVRQGGKPYIRVMSSQAIHDPYLRFVIEARTPTGRSLREYTVLLDPADYALRQPALEQDLPVVAKRATRAASPVQPLRAGSVEIAPGQTLMSLARRARPPQASLSQTMAAIFKANPHAFIAGNPERMLAGARVAIPGAARIAAISPLEATRLMSGNQGEVRREIAAIPAPVKPVLAVPKPSPAPAPTVTPVNPPTQAPVSAPLVAAPTVSPSVKLSAPEAGGDESAARLSALELEIANRDRSLQQTQEKIVQLENRLKQMQLATQSVVVPEEEASFTDGLFSQLPLIGGGLAALALALFGGNLLRKRREAARVGAAFGARPLGAATGLQHGPLARTLQTGAANGNSFLTDFTRSGMGSIDAGEVDPVAEAEVYLAYGRDQQAEDILLDALSKDPTRHEVRLKLLEIYATRADKTMFEPHAQALKLALDGKGALWAKAAALGLALDPQNPLYADQESSPLAAMAAPVAMAAGSMIDLDAELSDLMPAAVAAPMQSTVLDFDTALSTPAADGVVLASEALIDDDPLRAALFGDEPAPEPAAAPAVDTHTLEFDLDALLGDMKAPVVPEAPAAISAAPALDDNLLDFDFQLGSAIAESEPLAAPAAAGTANEGFDGLFEFDMESDPAGRQSLDALTADLEAEFAPVSTAGMDVSDDPLATKLDLAHVYIDMGDKEGAREVLLELMSEADGLLHKEAETLLATL
ncbi:FimV/HubP family polar landmark protein [Craterilacuibacter sp.]|uniref:FimV/HubP family polar landmark protein n=1 Tax=Craterilacuibacter sp. TaxID=2870909 RepID=UPI003F398B6A